MQFNCTSSLEIAQVHLKLHGVNFKLYDSDRLDLVKVSHDS